MAYRAAKSLDKLLQQIDDAAPKRVRLSDGWIGDTDHQNRASDHNPHCRGFIVTARDFTHDPANGADMNKWANALRESRDTRIKYVIWNRRMYSSYASGGYPAWAWRPYTGVNMHTQHMHVSVHCGGEVDSTRKWAQPRVKEWDEMASKSEIREVVREEVQKAVQQLAVGKEDNWNKQYMNLKDLEERLNRVLERR